MRTTRVILSASAALASGASGQIVVGHDVNTLSSSIADSVSEAFAVNVADFLTGGSGRLLLIESSANSQRNYAPGVVNALAAAGYAVTVDVVADGYASEIGQLATFEAVFFGVQFNAYTIPDVQALRDFVAAGGGVYVFGGNGNVAQLEADALNVFLADYGLGFEPSYNGINSVVIDGSHPVFDGLVGDALLSGNGSIVTDLDPLDGAGRLIQLDAIGRGAYAVWDPRCPADLDDDGDADSDDFFVFLDLFTGQDSRADINGDGAWDGDDFFAYLDLFAQGC